MRTYIVYKAICKINSKSYIGYTNSDKGFEIRKYEHLLNALRHNKKSKFYNCLRKYTNDFIWEIIIQNIESKDEAKKLEIEYIIKYDSYKNGLNSTEGGDGGNTRDSYVLENNPNWKQLNKEIETFVIESYKNGLGKTYISKETGLGFTKITNILKLNNVKYIEPLNKTSPWNKIRDFKPKTNTYIVSRCSIICSKWESSIKV